MYKLLRDGFVEAETFCIHNYVDGYEVTQEEVCSLPTIGSPYYHNGVKKPMLVTQIIKTPIKRFNNWFNYKVIWGSYEDACKFLGAK